MYIGLVPARAGSKGIPRKNVSMVGGKPLVEWTFECALKVPSLHRIVCTSDCQDVLDIASKLNIDTIRRPLDLAQDATHIIDVVKHALSTSFFQGCTHVVLLQPTSPFRNPNTVERCIQLSMSSSCDTVITAYENKHYHPSLIFKDDADSKSPDWLLPTELTLRRQDYSRFLVRSGICYVSKANLIRTHSSLYGKIIKYVESSSLESLNIDNPADLVLANHFCDK